MTVLALIWVLAGALGLVRAMVVYITGGRYANNDRMRASIVFVQMWMTAAFCLALGVVLMPIWHWTLGFFTLILAYFAMFLVKGLIGIVLRPFGWGLRLHPDDFPREGFRRHVEIENVMRSRGCISWKSYDETHSANPAARESGDTSSTSD